MQTKSRARRRIDLKLLPMQVTRTGDVDFGDRYDAGLLGMVLRRRLRWVLRAIPNRPIERVLDVGYGSGVLLPSLAVTARHLVGIDVHTSGAQVRRSLGAAGISASLVQADACALPFKKHSFDLVTAVSALEFVPDPAAFLAECSRVLTPGGIGVALVPQELRWADALWKAFSGVDPEKDFAGGRGRVRAATAGRHDIVTQPRPWPMPRRAAPYLLLTWRGLPT